MLFESECKCDSMILHVNLKIELVSVRFFCVRKDSVKLRFFYLPAISKLKM